MWPSSTCCLSGTQEARMARVSIAQARCGLLPLVHDGGEQEKSGRFNRSSAMWPSSTPGGRVARTVHGQFQSLKRDVAFFHAGSTIRGPGISKCFNRSSAMWPSSTATSSCFLRKRRRVSIAQARCGLLPHQYHDAAQDGQLGGFNRSSAMWPSSTLSMLNVETITVGFQSLKRDVAFFHMWCTNLN